MNPDLAKLHRYPFERLAALKQGLEPPLELEHIALSIGEPRHEPPALVKAALTGALDTLGSYPVALGIAPLRETCAGWLERRYKLPAGRVDPERMVQPVNGTREGLFAFAQAVVDRSSAPLVAMPNPFYQIYEGAALLAGAEPFFLNTPPETDFLPDLDAVPETVWKRCQLLYLCSPGNPTGAVMDETYLEQVIALADRYDFVIASDECYAEIYLDEERPPPGLLQVCERLGRTSFDRCVVRGRSRGSPPHAGESRLPHLPRLRRAPAHPACERGGLAGRRARAPQPRTVPGEIRPRPAGTRAGARGAAAPGHLLPVAEHLRRRGLCPGPLRPLQRDRAARLVPGP